MWISNAEFDADLKSIKKLGKSSPETVINKNVKELCRIS
jgi:hypothetical protein